jgi:hypothetical protein
VVTLRSAELCPSTSNSIQGRQPPPFSTSEHESYHGSHPNLAPSGNIRASGRFRDCRSVTTIVHLHEQALGLHAGQIAARNANVGQVSRSHLKGECDRPFSEGGFRTAGQPDSLSSVAVTLPNLGAGSGVVLRGIGSTRFAVSFSPGSHPNFSRRGMRATGDVGLSVAPRPTRPQP